MVGENQEDSSKQMSQERDQPSPEFSQQPRKGIVSKLASLLVRIGGKVEETAVRADQEGIDPDKLNPNSTKEPKKSLVQTSSGELGKP